VNPESIDLMELMCSCGRMEWINENERFMASDGAE